LSIRPSVPDMDSGKSSCRRIQCPQKRFDSCSMRLFMNNPG
jgi:hypothetical protein